MAVLVYERVSACKWVFNSQNRWLKAKSRGNTAEIRYFAVSKGGSLDCKPCLQKANGEHGSTPTEPPLGPRAPVGASDQRMFTSSHQCSWHVIHGYTWIYIYIQYIYIYTRNNYEVQEITPHIYPHLSTFQNAYKQMMGICGPIQVLQGVSNPAIHLAASCCLRLMSSRKASSPSVRVRLALSCFLTARAGAERQLGEMGNKKPTKEPQSMQHPDNPCLSTQIALGP